MSKFASHENTYPEQQAILHELETLLDAVDVTGLEGWERIKAIHGGLGEEAARPLHGSSPTDAASSPSPFQPEMFPEAA